MFGAVYKRITSKSWSTAADTVVINNLVQSVLTTCAKAWVNTFLLNASLVLCTISTHYTFRSTEWCTANTSRQTWTNCKPIHRSTCRIWSTRWRYTWIFWIAMLSYENWHTLCNYMLLEFTTCKYLCSKNINTHATTYSTSTSNLERSVVKEGIN